LDLAFVIATQSLRGEEGDEGRTREVDTDEKDISIGVLCAHAIPFVFRPNRLLCNRARGIERNPEPI
jgi:hypothetical protein